jgi:predicted transcriptional regulator of viral defense system
MEKLIAIFKDNSGFLQSKSITCRTQWRALNRMMNDNSVSKVKRGLYRLNDYDHDSSFIEVSKIVPSGIICMFSAWFYYGLTTTIPHENHIAVTQNKKIILPDYPPVRLYYLSEKFYQLGVTQIGMDGSSVKIYDLEKSVCDAVRFRNKVGLDIAFEVVKNYVRRKDRNLNKVSEYARLMRVEKIMQYIIMPML